MSIYVQLGCTLHQGFLGTNQNRFTQNKFMGERFKKRRPVIDKKKKARMQTRSQTTIQLY